MTRRPLAAGNWKMNGTAASLDELHELISSVGSSGCDVMLCLPATLIARAADIAAETSVAIGGQTCHPATSGAHTGDVSAEMLADAGATAVIVGHSERRADHGETDATVRAQATAAWSAGLTAIICVGETEAERDAGRALAVVTEQLMRSIPEGATAANTVIAYEPVWAIGTGRTPSITDIDEMHRGIRAAITSRVDGADAVRLLYGGSMKPSNAAEIMAVEDVDGGLVGGASLKAADFAQIVAAAS
ncbi:MAG: triose-phosphate isomerase [Pseudomonadota bacterium]